MTYEAIWASGILVRWRGLSHKQYREIRARWGYPQLSPTSPMGLYAEVYERCLVDGLPIEECPAGIMSQIGRHQLNHNQGFLHPRRYLPPLHSGAGFRAR